MRLPPELLALVIAHIPARQKRTLAALMSVSSACYALAGKKLYAELRVSSSNLAGVLRGLDRGACDCAAVTPPSSPARGRCPVTPTASQTLSSGPGESAKDADGPETSASCGCPCAPHDSGLANDPPKRKYPIPASDERKRALLAFTRYLTVESVPDCRCWSPPTTVRTPGVPGGPIVGPIGAAAAATACPLNKTLLPNVRVVRVMACVPQHAVVAFERRRR